MIEGHPADDDERTEGDVLEVRCTPSDPPGSAGATPPYAVIANVDGNQTVRLRQAAAADCQQIHVGDYLEADGEKQHEHLFDADGVKIRVPMP